MMKKYHQLAYDFRRKSAEGVSSKDEETRDRILDNGRKLIRLEARVQRFKELLKMIET